MALGSQMEQTVCRDRYRQQTFSGSQRQTQNEFCKDEYCSFELEPTCTSDTNSVDTIFSHSEYFEFQKTSFEEKSDSVKGKLRENEKFWQDTLTAPAYS